MSGAKGFHYPNSEEDILRRKHGSKIYNVKLVASKKIKKLIKLKNLKKKII